MVLFKNMVIIFHTAVIEGAKTVILIVIIEIKQSFFLFRHIVMAVFVWYRC